MLGVRLLLHERPQEPGLLTLGGLQVERALLVWTPRDARFALHPLWLQAELAPQNGIREGRQTCLAQTP